MAAFSQLGQTVKVEDLLLEVLDHKGRKDTIITSKYSVVLLSY